MKKIISFLLFIFLLFLSTNIANAGGTFKCSADNQECINNCTNGDIPDCTADPSGYAACLGPYTNTPCIANPNPPQPGDCPGLCVNTAACLQVIPGYAGKCGDGRECCQASLPGGQPTGGSEVTCEDGTGINTAIGCIPFGDTNALMGFILRWAIGVGGGIAFLLIIFAGFQIMTSSGNPERLKAGQELLTSAIAGLIMLVFSVFILRVIGVDILNIPGFGT